MKELSASKLLLMLIMLSGLLGLLILPFPPTA
jgi:hypothetical protein